MHTGILTPDVGSPPLLRDGFPSFSNQASPAAATDFTAQVAGQYYERLLTVWCRLVTASDVGDRAVTLQFQTDNGNVYRTCGAATVAAASTTIDYSFSVFQPATEFPVDATILVPLDPILIPPTFKWALHLVGAQTTDAISRVRVYSERFFSDSPIPGRDYGTDQ